MNKKMKVEKQGLTTGDEFAVYPFPGDEFDKIIRVDFSQTDFSSFKDSQKKKSDNTGNPSAIPLQAKFTATKIEANKPRKVVTLKTDDFEHNLALKIVESTQNDFNQLIKGHIKHSFVVGTSFTPLDSLNKKKADDFEEQLTLYLTHNYQLEELTISNLLKFKIISQEISNLGELQIILNDELVDSSLYLFAFAYYLDKQYKASFDCLSRITKLGYKEVYLRGVLYSKFANLEGAASDLQQVFPVFASDIVYLELAITVFREHKQLDYLIKSLKRALKLDPKKLKYSEELIELLFIQEKFLEIIAYIKQLVVLRGSITVEIQYLLGVSYGMLGLNDAALGRFENILELEGLSYLEALYKMQESPLADSKIIFLIAFYFFNDKKYDKCLDYLFKQNSELVDRIALLVGHCYILRADFVKADEVLQKEHITLEYLLPEFYYLRAILFYETNDYEKAEASFKLSVDMGFLGKKIYFYKALIAFSHEDYLRALDYYKLSLNQGYRSAEVYRGMATVATNLKMYSVALSAYKELKSMYPDDFRVDNAIGILYAKLGDYKNSINCFKAILEHDEYNKEAHWNLSLAYKLILEDNMHMHLERFTEIDGIGDGDLSG